jgi:arylsulfatase A-like enzyme
MLTGLTPRQHGLISNGNMLDENVPTVTAALVSAGYRTHSVGKLHLQPFVNIERNCDSDSPIESWESEYPWRHGRIDGLPKDYYGFQTAEFLEGHGYYTAGDYNHWLNSVHPDPDSLYEEGNLQGRFKPDTIKNLPSELHYNHWIADRCIAFLDECDAEQPFFLWCSFPDPHHPFSANKKHADQYDPSEVSLNPTWQQTEAPCDYLERFRAERPVLTEDYLREITVETYGMITHLDEQIGRVIQHLEETGQNENTVMVFMSDHGEYLGSHGLHQKELWPYEELNRIPFVWKAPSGTPGASESVVSMLDFVPTLLDYAGLSPAVLDRRQFEPYNGRFLAGRSLRSWLDLGEPLADRPALIEFERGPDSGPRTLVESRWKLTVFPPTGQGMFYDLMADPNETCNLWDNPNYAKEKSQLVLRLLQELAMSDRIDKERGSWA